MGNGNPLMRKGGPSLNPSGKTKDGRTGRSRDIVNEIIDRVASPGAEEEIRIIALAARGIMRDPHIPDSFIRVDSKTAATCATWIAEQRHGKAPQAVEVGLSGEIEHHHGTSIDLSRLAGAELGTLERLLEKGADDSLTDLQDAELVPSVSPAAEPVRIQAATDEKNTGSKQ